MLSHDMFICVCAFYMFWMYVTLYFSVNYASSNDTSSILSEPLIRVTVISAVFRCFRFDFIRSTVFEGTIYRTENHSSGHQLIANHSQIALSIIE